MNSFLPEHFPEFDNHHLVISLSEKKSGLHGFIAIHSTKKGVAVGGTRYWAYSSEKEAVRDVLNLSRAMTYKCALARVPYGGAKGVIIADSKQSKGKVLETYAQRINLLNGSFHTGEDVGINEKDILLLAKKSRFIIGRPGVAGDPSPWAARGVFYAMEAGLKFLFGNSQVQGRTFAIKGLGKVGGELCRLIFKHGGSVIGAEIDQKRLHEMRRRFPKMRVVSPANIHKQNVDVYAPCALGNEFSQKTIAELKCSMICGGANNQLSSSEAGKLLQKKGVLYIPDYLANAGGLINVVAELDRKGYSKKRVEIKVKRIAQTTRIVLDLAQKYKKSISETADELARSIFSK